MTIKNTDQKVNKKKFDKNFDKINWKDDKHYEYILCPECGEIQKATVLHTFPWYSYVHDCKCGYTIMESDWCLAEEKK